MLVKEEKDCMKPLSYAVIIFILTFSACKKGNSSNAVAGKWQLAQKDWSIGASSHQSIPSWDSTVVLQLNSNGTYVSQLFGHTVAQGSYLILPDTGYYIKQILNLHDFKTTGLFSLFTISQLSATGQVLSTFNGFFMTVNNNTLTLSSAITPGGNVSYTFVRI